MHQEPHGPSSRTRIDFSLEACLAQIIDHAELATAGERDSSRNADLPFCDEDGEYMEHAIECGTLNNAHDEAVEADAMNNMHGVELPIKRRRRATQRRQRHLHYNATTRFEEEEALFGEDTATRAMRKRLQSHGNAKARDGSVAIKR